MKDRETTDFRGYRGLGKQRYAESVISQVVLATEEAIVQHERCAILLSSPTEKDGDKLN